jgi:indole-3-glycerol phosphate synthase
VRSKIRELAALLRFTEEDLGMDALVEVHTQGEMQRAAAAGATLIGVNNRNLDTFDVSLETSIELAAIAPHGATLVSESGLRDADDLRRLLGHGYHGFLIGETLMRARNPRQALAELIAACER